MHFVATDFVNKYIPFVDVSLVIYAYLCYL